MSREKFSILNLAKHALTGHRDWKPTWRDAAPQTSYDVIIIGGGGHGLATAHYLAKEFGIQKIAVLERGWIGGGNVGRNTTNIRSNYLLPANVRFYEHSLKLWEHLEQELNYNAMVSQRGFLQTYHSDAQRDAYVRRGNAMRLEGVDAELVDREGIKSMVPFLDLDNARFPILGGMLQRRAGTVRHDAVVWGYARAASDRGVDIIQNCEVTGLDISNGKITGVQTSRGPIRAKKVAMAVAGSTTKVADMAGLRLPIETHVLQAFVTEGLKPLVPCIVSYGMGHFYINQSDKGGLVFGGSLDGYNSYAQRGGLNRVEEVLETGMAMMPILSRIRLLRGWGGLMDMSMDSSPIIDMTSIEGLFINCGWCYGGFKAIPASGVCYAHLIARGEHHPDAAAFRLNRFETGAVLDERGTGPTPGLH